MKYIKTFEAKSGYWRNALYRLKDSLEGENLIKFGETLSNILEKEWKKVYSWETGEAIGMGTSYVSEVMDLFDEINVLFQDNDCDSDQSYQFREEFNIDESDGFELNQKIPYQHRLDEIYRQRILAIIEEISNIQEITNDPPTEILKPILSRFKNL